MKLLPQITRSDLNSLAFRTSLEIAAGGVMMVLLLRWITL